MTLYFHSKAVIFTIIKSFWGEFSAFADFCDVTSITLFDLTCFYTFTHIHNLELPVNPKDVTAAYLGFCIRKAFYHLSGIQFPVTGPLCMSADFMITWVTQTRAADGWWWVTAQSFCFLSILVKFLGRMWNYHLPSTKCCKM